MRARFFGPVTERMLDLADWPRTSEENQVRKLQFMAMVERRDEAARPLLADAAARPRFCSTKERAAHSTEDGNHILAEGRTVLPADDGLAAAPHVTNDDLARRMTLLQ